jgi:hypothetical protein
MTAYPEITLAVKGRLLSSPSITDLVGAQVFVNRLPQDVEGSAIILWLVTGSPWNALDRSIGTDQSLIQIDSYGDSPGAAGSIGWQVWQTLDGAIGVFAGVSIIGAARESGPRQGSERPLAGTQQYRFISSQDFRFTFRSIEKVLP